MYARMYCICICVSGDGNIWIPHQGSIASAFGIPYQSGLVVVSAQESYKASEPRQEEPSLPKKPSEGPRAPKSLLGLIGLPWLPFPMRVQRRDSYLKCCGEQNLSPEPVFSHAPKELSSSFLRVGVKEDR